MSKCGDFEINCPGCGQPSMTTVLESVNVGLDPALRQRVIDDQLNPFTCPKCGFLARIRADFLYHDMVRKFMVWCCYPSEDGVRLPAEMPADVADKMVADGYRLRMVESQDQLVEKILVFEEGLNDRAVEVLKAILRHQDESLKAVPAEAFLFHGLENTPEGKELELALMTEDGYGSSLNIPLQNYTQIEQVLQDSTIDPAEERSWLKVDLNYARKLIDEETSE